MIIYKITNRLNGLVYIGLSVSNSRKRWRDHLSQARRGKPKQRIDRAIRAHGHQNFSYEVLETIDRSRGVALLEEREQFWISHYASHERDKGYNLSLGTYTNVGHQRSDEYRAAAKQRTGSPVLQYDAGGKLLRSFDSVTHAAKHCKIRASNIRRVLRKGRGKAAGYIWKKASQGASAESVIDPKEVGIKTRAKAIHCFLPNGTLVKSYESSISAARELKVSPSTISEALNGKAPTACGYLWSVESVLPPDRLQKVVNKGKGARKARPVVLFDDQGERIAEFQSALKASRAIGVSNRLISKACRDPNRQIPTKDFGPCRCAFGDVAPARMVAVEKRAVRRWKKQVAQYTLLGEIVCIHESITAAAAAVGTLANNITNALRSGAKTCAGFQWLPHSDGSPAPSSLPPVSLKLLVCQYGYDGKLIAVHETYEAAAKAVDRSLSTIWSAAASITYSAAGYFWRLCPADEIEQSIATPPPRCPSGAG